MLQVRRVKYIKDHIIWVSLSDGSKGNVDCAGLVDDSLKDKAIFAKLRLDSKIGTVTWPHGVSLTPELLKANIARANFV